jgi:hypothetical protein
MPAKTKFSGIRQYNPTKPVKWGFKNLIRAGASGFMYDFYIYAGQDEAMDNVDFKDLQKCCCATLSTFSIPQWSSIVL